MAGGGISGGRGDDAGEQGGAAQRKEGGVRCEERWRQRRAGGMAMSAAVPSGRGSGEQGLMAMSCAVPDGRERGAVRRRARPWLQGTRGTLRDVSRLGAAPMSYHLWTI